MSLVWTPLREDVYWGLRVVIIVEQVQKFLWELCSFYACVSFDGNEGRGGGEWCNVGAWRSEAHRGCFQVFFNGDGIFLEVPLVRMIRRSSSEGSDINGEFM